MAVTLHEDRAERYITLDVRYVPDIPAEQTYIGKSFRVRQVIMEFHSRDGAPWKWSSVKASGIKVNRNGQMSVARNAEITENYTPFTEHTPAWLLGLVRDWTP